MIYCVFPQLISNHISCKMQQSGVTVDCVDKFSLCTCVVAVIAELIPSFFQLLSFLSFANSVHSQL